MGPVLRRMAAEVQDLLAGLRALPVAVAVGPAAMRAHLAARFGFEGPRPAAEVVLDVAAMLRRWTVHGGHPRYFGPSAQSVDPTGIAAAVLAARLGLPENTAATFTSGASESTLSALVVALTRALPDHARLGLAGGPRPTVYVSAQGHPSLTKLALAVGIGRDAVRVVPCDDALRMDPDALSAAITRDRAHGVRPTVVVATAGTTEAGAIDPLAAIADLCAAEGLWLHVDAAWGGAAALSARYARCLDGIGRADSVAWDAHKGLGVPVGAGMFFCRHPGDVRAAFQTGAAYMPRADGPRPQPFALGLQWSRRFIGLPLLMTLAEHGLAGVGARVERQADLADRLREGLRARGWSLVNDSPLPVVCFTHPAIRAGRVLPRDLVRRLRRAGAGWIAETSLRPGEPALRACVASQATTADDIDALVVALDDALIAGTTDAPARRP